MKTILRLNIIVLLASLLFSGCEKDEAKVTIDGGTPPVLTVTPGADVSYANAAEQALALSWTNPDYTFNTGVSSMDVNYNIEIDTVGANFTNPNKKVISIAKDLAYAINVSDMNDIMQNQLNLVPAVPHNLEIRVVSSLINSSVQLASNSVQYTATPYVIPPKVNPPASGELYLVGSATEGGWNNPVPTPTQQFTKIDDLHFTLTVSLIGGQEYLFLPVNGDWTHKYACKNKGVQSPNGGDFGADLSDNFPGPTADGTYKIDVDFQKGKYTVTKQ